jgi:hypothetical protein
MYSVQCTRYSELSTVYSLKCTQYRHCPLHGLWVPLLRYRDTGILRCHSSPALQCIHGLTSAAAAIATAATAIPAVTTAVGPAVAVTTVVVGAAAVAAGDAAAVAAAVATTLAATVAAITAVAATVAAAFAFAVAAAAGILYDDKQMDNGYLRCGQSVGYTQHSCPFLILSRYTVV